MVSAEVIGRSLARWLVKYSVVAGYRSINVVLAIVRAFLLKNFVFPTIGPKKVSV